jgi:hypothetical protein
MLVQSTALLEVDKHVVNQKGMMQTSAAVTIAGLLVGPFRGSQK